MDGHCDACTLQYRDSIEVALIISTTIIWMYAYYVILLSFSNISV